MSQSTIFSHVVMDLPGSGGVEIPLYLVPFYSGQGRNLYRQVYKKSIKIDKHDKHGMVSKTLPHH